MIIALAASAWVAAGLALGVRFAWHSGKWEELGYWDLLAFLFITAIFGLPVTALAIARGLVSGGTVGLKKGKGDK